MPPKFVRPCIPTTAKAIPQGDAWLHEPKLDGYRFQIVKDGRQVRLYSRNGHEWTRRLRRARRSAQGVPWQSAVLDAELCFPGADGGPDFGGLQGAARRPGRRASGLRVRSAAPGREDLTAGAVAPAQAIAEALGRSRGLPCLQPVQAFEDGVKLLEAAERHGLEGIVSKRKASAYSSGPLPRLGEDQDGGLASGEPGSVAMLFSGAGDAARTQHAVTTGASTTCPSSLL